MRAKYTLDIVEIPQEEVIRLNDENIRLKEALIEALLIIETLQKEA